MMLGADAPMLMGALLPVHTLMVDCPSQGGYPLLVHSDARLSCNHAVAHSAMTWQRAADGCTTATAGIWCCSWRRSCGG